MKWVGKAKNERYRRIIQSTRWRKMRNEFLSAHPLCQDCLEKGKTTLASEVHHIRPVESAVGDQRAMEALAYDRANLRALCAKCHVQAHVLLASRTKASNVARKKQEVDAFMRRMFLGSSEKEHVSDNR